MAFSYPLMIAIQEISARIGRTTGRGIAANLARQPNGLLQVVVVMLLIANTINIGANLGAMPDALRLLIGGPGFAYVCLFGFWASEFSDQTRAPRHRFDDSKPSKAMKSAEGEQCFRYQSVPVSCAPIERPAGKGHHAKRVARLIGLLNWPTRWG
jgi:hypothetical protein